MPELAIRLTNDAGRVVLDKTGLSGRYSYMLLNYTPGGAQANGAADATPDFYTAVEEQLGLKLVPKNEPVELIVVDRANRTPVENYYQVAKISVSSRAGNRSLAVVAQQRLLSHDRKGVVYADFCNYEAE